MASKKTEVVENPAPQVDYSEMNVYAKLLNVRREFMSEATKKSGVNMHAEFQYFELIDIVPRAEGLFQTYGLLLIPTFTEDKAVAEIVNADDPTESIKFSIPLKFIAEPAKFRMNEVQGVGAVVTYYRRYLYMVVLDLVESDGIDNQNPKGEDEPAKPKTGAKSGKTTAKKAPPTAAERAEITTEVTDADGAADDLMVQGLKNALKTLLEKDPDQEDFVQSVAIRTEAFSKITKAQCEQLIEGVKEMIAAYDAK